MSGLGDSRKVDNQPHDEELVLSDEDSLLEKYETLEVSAAETGASVGGASLGDTMDSPPAHYDERASELGYDDLMSESDVRESQDDKLGLGKRLHTGGASS